MSGSHRISKGRANNVTVDKQSIPSTVCIDRITHTTSRQIDIHQLGKPSEAQLADTHKAKPAKRTNQLHQTDLNKYVVDKIILYVGKCRNMN